MKRRDNDDNNNDDDNDDDDVYCREFGILPAKGFLEVPSRRGFLGCQISWRKSRIQKAS